MHALHSKFLWQPFSSKLPLGHLSNSKIHGGLWCKRWANKTCKGFHKKMQCSCKNQMKMKEIQTCMVEIKYEITTDLPVGKDSKFRVFWTRYFILSTLISLTKNFQSVAPHRKSFQKNSFLDVVSRVLGFIIWSSFDHVELVMIFVTPWYCPWR